MRTGTCPRRGTSSPSAAAAIQEPRITRMTRLKFVTCGGRRPWRSRTPNGVLGTFPGCSAWKADTARPARSCSPTPSSATTFLGVVMDSPTLRRSAETLAYALDPRPAGSLLRPRRPPSRSLLEPHLAAGSFGGDRPWTMGVSPMTSGARAARRRRSMTAGNGSGHDEGGSAAAIAQDPHRAVGRHHPCGRDPVPKGQSPFWPMGGARRWIDIDSQAGVIPLERHLPRRAPRAPGSSTR